MFSCTTLARERGFSSIPKSFNLLTTSCSFQSLNEERLISIPPPVPPLTCPVSNRTRKPKAIFRVSHPRLHHHLPFLWVGGFATLNIINYLALLGLERPSAEINIQLGMAPNLSLHKFYDPSERLFLALPSSSGGDAGAVPVDLKSTRYVVSFASEGEGEEFITLN